MKQHPLIHASWCAINVLLIISLAAVVYSATWEFSTRSYLRGFSDAIVPSSDNPQQKVEAILAWMAHGPARRIVADPGALAPRDPEETLNVEQLLEVCGTATNAFVNIAQSSGLSARRLLLIDKNGTSKHVVVEVLIDNRWVVIDPSYHSVLRLPDGQMVTRDELRNPVIFKAVTRSIPNYPQNYTYEKAVHVRMRRIPFVGPYLRRIFTRIWPSWEVKINWTLLLERESFAALIASLLVLCFALAARIFLGWYCTSRLGIFRVRLRDQIVHAGQILVGNSF